jgi:hypothetical protein
VGYFLVCCNFQKKGLCLNPTVSFVQNIGFDGTGVHCGETAIYLNSTVCKKKIDFASIPVRENKTIVKRKIKFNKRINKQPFLIRVLRKILKFCRNKYHITTKPLPS